MPHRPHRRHRPAARTQRGCPLGKRRFPDHRSAVDALHRSAVRRHWANLHDQPCHRREVRAYECAACKGYHLTSQPEQAAA